MLKRLGFIILTLICINQAGVANKKDSNQIKTDAGILKDSIPFYLTESEHLRDSLPQLAVKYSNRARILSSLLEMKEQEAFASKLLGSAKINVEDYYEAEKYLSLSLKYYNKTKKLSIIGEIHFLLGITEYHLANYTKSLDHYLKALQIFKELESKSKYANTLQNMGLLFFAMEDIVKALEYYNAALKLYFELENQENVAGLYQNLGIVSFKNNNDSTALAYFNKSIKFYKEQHDLRGIGISYSNIGLIYMRNRQSHKAYRNFKKSHTYFTKTRYKLGQMWALNNMGSALAMQGEYASAKECFFRSLSLSSELNSPEGLISNYKDIAEFYEKRGYFYNALKYYKKETALKDSLSKINSHEKISELETLYKLESRERVQAELIGENKRQKTQIWAISGFISILILASLVVLLAHFQKKQAEKKLAEHKNNLEKLIDKRTIELQRQISGRKIAEESDKLKSAFLANMSHELRTPMNAIIAFSNFLREPDLNEEKKNEFLDHITAAGDSLLRLIDDIIDIAKIESKQLKIFIQPTSINRMLNELFKVFSETRVKFNKKQIRLKLKIDNKFNYIINTDTQRLKQVLTNLIENAFKYTDKGSIEFGFEPSENAVTFFVSDTGIGIPSDKKGLIFDRFYQLNYANDRKTSGTGLGLAICKNLVSLLGGTISVESEEGNGSTFYIKIPVESLKRQPNPVYPEKNTPSKKLINTNNYNWNNITILVAEDEDLNYKVLDTFLTRTKAHIIRAKDGASAIEICRNQKVDVVLMDIQLPGVDGYEATQEIKKLNNRTPVIAQTSFAMAGEKEKCLQAGCDDFVSKPLNINLLMEKIEHYLR